MIMGRKQQPESELEKPEWGFDAFDVRLGDLMRGERATMGKSLLDIQRDLKIKATYIAAIENSDPSVFETPGFIAGYVRSYARYLNMDPEWAFETFCKESDFAGVDGLSGQASTKGRSVEKTPGAKLVEDPFGGTFAGLEPIGEGFLSQIEPRAIVSTAVLLGLIGMLGFGAWSVLQEVQRVQFAPADQSPAIADTSGFGTEVEIAGDFTAPTPDALDRLYRPQVLETPIFTARDAPIASLELDNIGALARQPVAAAVSNDLPFTPVDNPFVGPLQPAKSIQVFAEDAPDVTLFAIRPAWVRVSTDDGSVLFEKILNAGEQFVLPQTDEAFVLRAGNSGAVFFDVRGKTFGPAGNGTSVAKNVALSVEAISEAYAEADPSKNKTLATVLKAMAETAPKSDDAEPVVE